MTVQCETHLCSVVQSVQNLCKICARGGGLHRSTFLHRFAQYMKTPFFSGYSPCQACQHIRQLSLDEYDAAKAG